MYKVLKSEPETFPKETFGIYYEVDIDGSNSEWRICAKDIIDKFSKSHTIQEVDVPPFYENEDFTELKYKLDGAELTLSCDFLLYSIYVTTDSEKLTKELRHELGSMAGWESE
ncbi:MAG: hypothetical protein KBT87_14755 [Gammaproteobacteria bacterium]|nr:hypothetical protein [Gammaproteobacteria bacterium]